MPEAVATPSRGVGIAGLVQAFRVGARLALHRIGGSATAWLSGVALASLLAVVWLERGVSVGHAASRGLFVLVRYVLPLALFVVVRRAREGQRLEWSVWTSSRDGLSRRGVLFGLVSTTALFCAAGSGLLGLAGLVMAYGAAPGLVDDVTASLGVLCLCGSLYTLWLFLASTWGRQGRGAWWFLAADFVFGADAGLLGLVLPRAQLSHLLGFGQLIPLSQWASSWLIAGWMVALMVAIVSRVRG